MLIVSSIETEWVSSWYQFEWLLPRIYDTWIYMAYMALYTALLFFIINHSPIALGFFVPLMLFSWQFTTIFGSLELNQTHFVFFWPSSQHFIWTIPELIVWVDRTSSDKDSPLKSSKHGLGIIWRNRRSATLPKYGFWNN